jgi:hypothetical protein
MGFAISPYSIIIEDKFSQDDAVYIIDMDKLGLIDDILHVTTDEIFIVIDTGETFIIANINDKYIINLDSDRLT